MVITRGQSPPAKLVPLRDAPEKFASPHLWRELDEALARPLPPPTNINEQNGVEGMRVAGMAIARALEAWSTRSEPFDKMRKALVQRLRDSKLEAWGVQSAPKQKLNLERIQSHFFSDAKINWNRNRISNFGVIYVAVGICRSVPAPNNKNILSSKNPSLGRPSKASDVERAIDLLIERHVDVAAMPRPNAYRAIRRCAERDLKANTSIGFSDPVIQRALQRRFGPRR